MTVGDSRSPESKKRKAPANQAKGSNGPSAKKAKPSKEASSSEESSSEDEKPPKAASGGIVSVLMHHFGTLYSNIRLYSSKTTLQSV